MQATKHPENIVEIIAPVCIKDTYKIKDGDEDKVVAGDEILVTAQGKLTTIYHSKLTGL